MLNAGSALLAAALSVAATGCFVTTADGTTTDVSGTEPARTATLIVKWTITGLSDPNECIKAQARRIEISVVDTAGSEVGAYQQACTAFSTSITLRPGTYTATAALLDDADRPRTTDAPISQFTLRANESLTVSSDFPSNSFR